MTVDRVDDMVRRAIGGDRIASRWLVTEARSSDVSTVLVAAALLEREPSLLTRARELAATSRERQIVEIARAHLAGQDELVDALARDHLVDHPDSLLIAWVAGNRRAHIEPDIDPHTGPRSGS